jgi:hypothetical protein
MHRMCNGCEKNLQRPATFLKCLSAHVSFDDDNTGKAND